jgi:hypothetical protein
MKKSSEGISREPEKHILIDTKVPGYSVRALGAVIGIRPKDGFVPKVDIRNAIRDLQLDPKLKYTHKPGERGLDKHREEMAENAGFFIDEAWSVLKHDLEQHGDQIYFSEEKQSGWVSADEVKNKLEGVKSFSDWQKKVYKMFKAHIENIAEASLQIRDDEFNLQGHDSEDDSTDSRNANLLFNRQKELIGFGDHNIRVTKTGEPVKNIYSYIAGGFETTVARTLGYQRLLIELYKLKFKKPITKEELASLSQRPPLLSFLPSLSTADSEIIRSSISRTQANSVDYFDPNAFTFITTANGLSLEIKPENLQKIIDYLSNPKNHKSQIQYAGTGCPAHQTISAQYSQGGSKIEFGERITLEVYDWVSKVVLELTTDKQLSNYGK